MKGTRKLIMLAVTIAAAAVFSLSPATAFAKTEGGLNAPDAPVSDMGGGTSDAEAPDAGGVAGADLQDTDAQAAGGAAGGGSPGSADLYTNGSVGNEPEAADEIAGEGTSAETGGDAAVVEGTAEEGVDAADEGDDTSTGASVDTADDTECSFDGGDAAGSADADGPADGLGQKGEGLECPDGSEDKSDTSHDGTRGTSAIDDGDAVANDADGNDEEEEVGESNASIGSEKDEEDERTLDSDKSGLATGDEAIDVSASASDDETADAETDVSNDEASLASAVTDIDSTPTALLSAAAENDASASDLLELVQKLIVAACTGDPIAIAAAGVDWGLGELIKLIFGTSVEGGDATNLQDILNKLTLIQNSLNELQKTANSQQLDNILTTLQPQLNAQGLTPYLIFNSLKSYDDQQKAGTLDETTAKKNRLKALTTDMGIDAEHWAAVNNDFDLYAQNLWRVMTDAYPVTLNGKSQDLTLMQVFYEHLRMKYSWENQAYDEWSEYQSRYVGLLTTTLTLEKASLQARIELLKESSQDYESVAGLLAVTQDCLNQLVGYKGKDATGKKDVDYPGIFSEKTWAAQYWMCKERDDVRYYWVPGHEVLFYSEVMTQDVPQENTKAGILHHYSNLHGATINWYYHSLFDWGYTAEPEPRFYWDFLTYKNGSASLASADQLKMLSDDYGGSTTLDTILMSADQGNFTTSANRDYANWRFVVCMDNHHGLAYAKNSKGADYVFYPVRTLSNTDEYLPLWYYHYKSAERGSTGIHFVGIGVKRVGPETYDPNGNNGDDPFDPMWHTAVEYTDDLALWWPSLGDLTLGYSADMLGGVKHVLIDGMELGGSCYKIQGDRVVLAQAYLSSLGFGEHELTIDTKEGIHRVIFSTQADGTYYVESGDSATWTRGSDGGRTFVFKRTQDDSQTLLRLVGVLVDGIPVPTWGYTVHSGSAVIMLTAAFLDTLAPGAHTLTAAFADGNDPTATFTVLASSDVQPAGSGSAVDTTQQGQTPRTGDDSLPAVTLLALTALVSAATAIRAKTMR